MESKCRFLKEYANFKKRELKENPDIPGWIAYGMMNDIDRIVLNKNRGLITLDEAMREIAEVGRRE